MKTLYRAILIFANGNTLKTSVGFTTYDDAFIYGQNYTKSYLLTADDERYFNFNLDKPTHITVEPILVEEVGKKELAAL